MKNKNLIMLLSLFIIPQIAFASTGYNSIPIMMVLFCEAFITIHMSIFVFMPLSKIIGKANYKKTFWTMFLIRVAILLIFDFFISTIIMTIDFFSVFIGAFLVVPIAASISRKKFNAEKMSANQINLKNNNIQSSILKCASCGADLKSTDKFCSNCGFQIKKEPVVKKIVSASEFGKAYDMPIDVLLEEFINKELIKCNLDKNIKLIPSAIVRKKKIFNILFSALLFIYTSLIFFHFPMLTYIIGAIILIIFYKITRKYSLVDYLKKEIKSRPSEKISNIIMGVRSSLVSDNSRKSLAIGLCLAIFLPIVVFFNPRILYEKIDDGYAVRFYTFGITNFTSATIPETYNGKPVVSLRGNTFSNMPFLKEVTLPNTIKEIRGQAFKNDKNLEKVNIPSQLEYLGGGAFYNCKSITSITLPDTLSYMGGEVFREASSLKYVRLSDNLTEIRGSSFENCTSLKMISIPDSVTRIGGHAFYGNTSLEFVAFSKNSKLKEIGSSAFRDCTKLTQIELPDNVSVNQKAFKGSPTVIRYFQSNDVK